MGFDRQKNVFRLAGLTLSLLVFCLCETSCVSSSSVMVHDPSAADRLQAGGSVRQEARRLARPLIERGQLHGAAVGILTPQGDIFTCGFGSTGLMGDGVPRSDTIFQVGSVSKLFVAALVAILVDEGQLHYNDTVGELLPATAPISADLKSITVYELVMHTSGLPREPSSFAQMLSFNRFLFAGGNVYACIDRPYLMDYLNRCHLDPGKRGRYHYSNIGFALLGVLIEHKTARTIPELVDEKICRPLKLCDTTFVLSEAQKKRLAQGHAGSQPLMMRRDAPMPEWRMSEVMAGSAGMYSTVHDLMIFAQANLGLLGLPVEQAMQSTQEVQMADGPDGVALGWVVTTFQGVNVVHKNGMIGGYHSFIGLNPESGTAVVVLSNTFSFKDKIGGNLTARIVQGLAGTQAGSADKKRRVNRLAQGETEMKN